MTSHPNARRTVSEVSVIECLAEKLSEAADAARSIINEVAWQSVEAMALSTAIAEARWRFNSGVLPARAAGAAFAAGDHAADRLSPLHPLAHGDPRRQRRWQPAG